MLLHDESMFPVSADYNFAVGSNLIAPGIDRTTFHSDSSRLTFKVSVQRLLPFSSGWAEPNCSSNLSKVNDFVSFPMLIFNVIPAVLCGTR